MWRLDVLKLKFQAAVSCRTSWCRASVLCKNGKSSQLPSFSPASFPFVLKLNLYGTN